MGLLDFVVKASRYLPQVSKPKGPLTLRSKIFWTALVLTIYLIFTQTPLYGIGALARGGGGLGILNIIFASRHGTLAELGIGPIVTAGIIIEILVGSKIVKFDFTNPEDRMKFNAAQRFLAYLFIIIEASAITIGYYGTLPTKLKTLVFLQLVAATILILLMDDLVQKWGIGSGISLFIAAGVAQQIFWLTINPVHVGDGFPLGALSALISAASRGEVSKVVVREGYPDLVALITTIFVFLIIIYLEGVKIEVPVVSVRYGGIRAKVPFKFLYVSNVPVIFAAALLQNLVMFSRILWLKAKNASWIKYLAVFEQTEEGRPILKGGLLYYITSPVGLKAALADPIRALTYVLFFTALCVFFAYAWVEVAGMSPEAQAEQLVAAGLQIPGFRSSKRIIAYRLAQYIPPLTLLSGLAVGLIAAIADMLGCLGTGMGVLLLIDILIQYHALIAQERALEMYPLLRKIVGRRRRI